MSLVSVVTRAWVVAMASSTGTMSLERPEPGRERATTASSIALANLDARIARGGDRAELVNLLLLRARFLSDEGALDRAERLAEEDPATPGDLLTRARARSALHRFREALEDVRMAEHLGGAEHDLLAVRASILIALGRADEVLGPLEAWVGRRPGVASWSALASAYAAVERFEEADHAFARALDGLDTTLPFPAAWIEFARGTMWAEAAHEPSRGTSHLSRAVVLLPEFVAAELHLAEIERSSGAVEAATQRLERIAHVATDPEALALLGMLHADAGELDRGFCEILLAAQRWEDLLSRHPLAYADHAAEFYLGPGGDPARAWAWARTNLANRRTRHALELAARAATASGRASEARRLEAASKALQPKKFARAGRARVPTEW
jgi:tetratricopeptide (TPR) repeat protein